MTYSGCKSISAFVNITCYIIPLYHIPMEELYYTYGIGSINKTKKTKNTHTCARIHTQTHRHRHRHTYIDTYIHTYMDTHRHRHTETHTQIHRHMQTHTQTHTLTHTLACMHACMHTQTHRHFFPLFACIYRQIRCNIEQHFFVINGKCPKI